MSWLRERHQSTDEKVTEYLSGIQGNKNQSQSLRKSSHNVSAVTSSIYEEPEEEYLDLDDQEDEEEEESVEYVEEKEDNRATRKSHVMSSTEPGMNSFETMMTKDSVESKDSGDSSDASESEDEQSLVDVNDIYFEDSEQGGSESESKSKPKTGGLLDGSKQKKKKKKAGRAGDRVRPGANKPRKGTTLLKLSKEHKLLPANETHISLDSRISRTSGVSGVSGNSGASISTRGSSSGASRLSTNSDKSQQSIKTTKRRSSVLDQTRKKSSRGGDHDRLIGQLDQIQQSREKLLEIEASRAISSDNQSWVKKKVDESKLLSCLSFKCREFMFEEDRKRCRVDTMRRKKFIRRRSSAELVGKKNPSVSFYPISQYFIYSDDTLAWYRKGGDHPQYKFTFDDCEMRFIGLDVGFREYHKKYAKRCDAECVTESRAKGFWLHQDRKRSRNAKPSKGGLDDLEREYRKIVSDLLRMVPEESDKSLFIDGFIKEMGVLLEVASSKEITRNIKLIKQEDFEELLLNYFSLSMLNSAMENKRAMKLFSHRFVGLAESTGNEKAISTVSRLISRVLKMLSRADLFLELVARPRKRRAMTAAGLKYLENKLFVKTGPGKRSKGKLVDGLGSSKSFRSNRKEVMYIDVLTDEVVKDKFYDTLFPKALLPDEWNNINISKFLKNPRREWKYQRNKWSLNYMKLMNSAYSICLVNNNHRFLRTLMNNPVPDLVLKVIQRLQDRVVEVTTKGGLDYIPEAAGAVPKLKDVGRRFGSSDSFGSQDLRQQEEEGKGAARTIERQDSFQGNAQGGNGSGADSDGYDSDDATKSFFGLLSRTGRTLIVKKKDGRKGFFNGFKNKERALLAYADTNAFSPCLNAFVRADLQYSSRGNICTPDCTGHQGLLLLTLIRLNNTESAELLLKNGVSPSIKICQNIPKQIYWCKDNTLSPYSEFLQQLKTRRAKKLKQQKTAAKMRKNKVWDFVSRTKRWFEKYNLAVLLYNIIAPQDEVNGLEDFKDVSNLADDSCLILRSKFKKTCPLAEALLSYGYESVKTKGREREKEETRSLNGDIASTETESRLQMIKVLISYGAEVTFNNNQPLMSLLPFVDDLAKARKKSQNKIMKMKAEEAKRRSRRYMGRQQSKGGGISFNKILSSLDVLKSRARKYSIHATGRTKTRTWSDDAKQTSFSLRGGASSDSSRHSLIDDNMSRVSGTTQALEKLDCLAFVVNKAEETLFSTYGDEEMNLMRVKLNVSLVMRVSILHEALLHQRYDTFRFVAPCHSVLDPTEMIKQTNSKDATRLKSLTNDIDPFTVESLSHVLDLLNYEMSRPNVCNFHVLLNGFYFIMEEYNLLPKKSQMVAVMKNIIQKLKEEFIAPAGVSAAVVKIMSSMQAQHFLMLKPHSFLEERHISLLGLRPRKGRKEIFTASPFVAKQIRGLRKSLAIESLRIGIYKVFLIIYKADGVAGMGGSSVLVNRFLEVLLVKKDISFLPGMLRVLKKANVSPDRLAKRVFEKCSSDTRYSFLILAFLSQGFTPVREICEDFIQLCIFNTPIANNEGFYCEQDRAADLSAILLFQKLMLKFFDRRQLESVKDAQRSKLFLSSCVFLQDIGSLLASCSEEDKEYVWYEGINQMIHYLDGYHLKFSEEQVAADPGIADEYEQYNAELERSLTELSKEAEARAAWEMFIFEDDKKMVLRACLKDSSEHTKMSGGTSMVESEKAMF